MFILRWRKETRIRSNNARAIAGLFLLVFALLSAGSRVVTGDLLPVRAYTTAEGLAQNTVNRIVRDSRGFLWFCTDDGLSRYDGYTFTNYGVAQGLPSSQVTDLLETRAGEYWVATFGGLCRFNPRGRPGPGGGRPSPTDPNNNQRRADSGRQTTDDPFTEDRAGNLWVGFADTDSLARFRDGRFTLFTSEDGLPAGNIYDLYLDHAGRLWIASTLGGLACLDDPSAERPQFVSYTTAQGLSSNNINCITEDGYGRLYVGTARGLDRLDPASGRVKPFTAADGLISGKVLVSFRDRKGDLWFGGSGGLSHLSPSLSTSRPRPTRAASGWEVKRAGRCS